jgi:hypothetical protein
MYAVLHPAALISAIRSASAGLASLISRSAANA